MEENKRKLEEVKNKIKINLKQDENKNTKKFKVINEDEEDDDDIVINVFK